MQLFATTAKPSKRAWASVSSLAVFLVAGSVVFGGCADDGHLMGSDGGAGSSSSAGVSGASVAGTGHSGASHGGMSNGGVSNGGSSNGGANSSGSSHGGTSGSGSNHGGTSSGGSGACNISECLRANVCLDRCGGKVVYTGCCACPANTVEETTCMDVGGQGSGGQANTSCVGATCSSTQTCVAYRTVGGAIYFVDDKGMCMPGKHPEGDRCEFDFSYTCAELMGCSSPSSTCRCAPKTQCASTTICAPDRLRLARCFSAVGLRASSAVGRV